MDSISTGIWQTAVYPPGRVSKHRFNNCAPPTLQPMHDKRCYVKLSSTATSRLRRLRRVALPLAFLVLWTGAARAEVVQSGPVTDARIALNSSGEPVVAYVADGLLSLASRDAATRTWSTRPLFILPSYEVELDGLAVAANGRTSVLLRASDGKWLALAAEVAPGRWSWRMIVPDTRRDLIGPAGLALDAAGRALVAYAL